MKQSKNETDEKISKRVKGKAIPKKSAFENIEDAKKLLELLQIHQIELEHQNEELRIMQEELEVSRNKYVNLFDFSPIPYFTIDIDGVIKEVNLGASKMIGIERRSLINKKFISYVSLDDRDIFNSFIQKVFNSSVKYSLELKMLSKDKRMYNVLLEGLEMNDTLEPDQKCQVAVIDLTEYKRVENSLKESKEKLEILNATKDKFFSIIAHDLRNPFNSLLGFSELLLTEIDTLSHEEILQFAKGLNGDLRNLYSLLENLLNWSMLQRNMLEIHPENIDISDEVNKVMGILNNSVLEKNISLTNNINKGTIVYADINMVKLIFQNLILNAIKFTQAGGLINVSSIEKEGFIEVTVRDTGVGIEPEKSSELFNFTSLLSTSGTAGEKGTGLGLPICKEFVEKHGGKIWVESELGKGTKFTFTLQKAIN
jgi:PAS domain S-box-containing protein